MYDVLTQMGRMQDARDWTPRSPAGGMRFEAVAGGTRITVLGEAAAPSLLASLMHHFTGPMYRHNRPAS
jgi:hypothetical protein